MFGDNRKRFCLGCQKDVYNLSAMPQRQAVKFAAKNEGKVCIRYARLQDGSILNADRIFHQISSRKAAVTAGVIAATVSLSLMTYAQEKPSLHGKTESKKVESRNKNSKLSQISFTIVDVTGAIVPSAQVTLTNKKTSKVTLMLSNQDGIAQFFSLESGRYDISVKCCGFDKYKNEIQLNQSVEPNVRITLNILSGAVGVFIFNWSDIPLFRAIAQKDNEVVKKAITDGFDVNTRDSYKNTALMVAVDHCNLEVVRLLLEHGARVNDKDAEKQTPIQKVSCDNDEEQDGAEIYRLLIANRADVNVRDEDGQTLLMKASENGSVDGVRLLLDAGAKPNLKDEDGETAYQKTDSEDIKKLLIQYGARSKKED